VTDGHELLARGALGVELGPEDVPPYALVPESQPLFLKASIEQFEGLEEADDVLVNSFREIEPKVSLALNRFIFIFFRCALNSCKTWKKIYKHETCT
jgi:hypothetical protein